MLSTIMAAAGVPDVKERLLKGMKVGDKTFKVHLDDLQPLHRPARREADGGYMGCLPDVEDGGCIRGEREEVSTHTNGYARSVSAAHYPAMRESDGQPTKDIPRNN